MANRNARLVKRRRFRSPREVQSTECDRAERRRARWESVAAWHPQHVLAHVGEDEVVVDRRRLVEPALPELPLDVVFLGVAVAAVAVDASVAGLPRRLGAEVLRHVGLAAAGLPGVEERRRLVAHEL